MDFMAYVGPKTESEGLSADFAGACELRHAISPVSPLCRAAIPECAAAHAPDVFVA
jgi:hypothetical protein